jgi:hypothetical protein
MQSLVGKHFGDQPTWKPEKINIRQIGCNDVNSIRNETNTGLCG